METLKCPHASLVSHQQMEPSPLYGEVIIALCLRGDVLPQLIGRQAGPRRVVTAAGDPVATLAAFAA